MWYLRMKSILQKTNNGVPVASLHQMAKLGCLHSFPFDEVPASSFQGYRVLQDQIFIHRNTLGLA